MTHANSIATYYEELPKLGKRADAVLGLYQTCPVPLTDREAKHLGGFDDMNQIRPRITELIRAGLLVETGRVKCTKTGKKVRLCEVNKGGIDGKANS